MPFYRNALNIFDVRQLPLGSNPRDDSDFLIEISEQEYQETKDLFNRMSESIKYAVDAFGELTKTTATIVAELSKIFSPLFEINEAQARKERHRRAYRRMMERRKNH